MIVVEVGGDVITRCPMCDPFSALAFAAWIEGIGYTPKTYESAPIAMEEGEQGRAVMFLRDFAIARRAALTAMSIGASGRVHA